MYRPRRACHTGTLFIGHDGPAIRAHYVLAKTGLPYGHTMYRPRRACHTGTCFWPRRACYIRQPQMDRVGNGTNSYRTGSPRSRRASYQTVSPRRLRTVQFGLEGLSTVLFRQERHRTKQLCLEGRRTVIPGRVGLRTYCLAQ